MKLEVLNISGGSTGRFVELPEDIFGITPNEHAVYLAVKQYQAAQRQGTHKTKEKWEVARTTKKFKRQKGTGGARAGSLKSPLFKGGGTVFGPRPRTYEIFLNKKVKRLARLSALSSKAANGSIKVVEDFTFDAPKTKKFVEVINSLGIQGKSLVVLPDYDNNVYLSARNIPGTGAVNVKDLNTYELLKTNTILFFESSLGKLN
ncbi:MAG: 50S ribosomal protein L4 [Saprospiraceae bacterium]|nr:50S ribosomal protein L4 [Saprospiraceae bacterium]